MDFASKVIWKSIAPSKVGFFAWKASWSRILTLDIIQKRGRVMANNCYLCREVEGFFFLYW